VARLLNTKTFQQLVSEADSPRPPALAIIHRIRPRPAPLRCLDLSIQPLPNAHCEPSIAGSACLGILAPGYEVTAFYQPVGIAVKADGSSSVACPTSGPPKVPSSSLGRLPLLAGNRHSLRRMSGGRSTRSGSRRAGRTRTANRFELETTKQCQQQQYFEGLRGFASTMTRQSHHRNDHTLATSPPLPCF
jgi:hypothetical protein